MEMGFDQRLQLFQVWVPVSILAAANARSARDSGRARPTIRQRRPNTTHGTPWNRGRMALPIARHQGLATRLGAAAHAVLMHFQAVEQATPPSAVASFIRLVNSVFGDPLSSPRP